MSRKLIPAPPATIPARFVAPDMSLGLSKAIESVTDPHPDTGTPPTFPWPVQAEARAVGDIIRHAAAAVPLAHLRAWVMPIIASAYVATDKTRTDENLEIWLASLQLGVGHLEVGAFTLETQRQALASIKFFPFVADICEIVAGPAVEIRTRFDALKRIIRSPTSPGAA